MSLSKNHRSELRSALQQTVVSCSERCLYQSSKWAAELLGGLPDDDDDDDDNSPYLSPIISPRTDPVEAQLEQKEMPKYLLAKTLFDCREFRRCAGVFLTTSNSSLDITLRADRSSAHLDRQPQSIDVGISQKALFLASHALLMAGRKQKTEDISQILGPLDTGAIVNKGLAPIRRLLETWLGLLQPQRKSSQGWLEYLYGQVLAEDKSDDLAINWLLRSVSINPWNWGAWQELCHLIRNVQHLVQVQSEIKPSIMGLMFSVYCRQELHHASPSLLSDISQLQSIFPRSGFLEGQRAMASYRMKDFHEANSLFSKMLASYPRQLDFLDDYSNVLHNLGDRATLAFVGQLASTVDRYRPETCYVVGNYLSLTSRHEKAVTYFKRALMLDRGYSSAWTLLGHEYLSLQNTHAAIESYRRAVELNRKDYRALFGLAQAYEVLENPGFSLHYYRRAVELRPAEVDLWQALARCYSDQFRFPQAISALKKALYFTSSNLRQPPGDDGRVYLVTCRHAEVLVQLSMAYEESNNRQEAIGYLELCLAETSHVQDVGETEEEQKASHMSILDRARLQLAQWAMEDGDHLKAHYIASQIDEDTEHGKEASGILSELG